MNNLNELILSQETLISYLIEFVSVPLANALHNELLGFSCYGFSFP